MSKQIKSNLSETVRMAAAVFLALFLGIYPAAISHVKAQAQPKAATSSRGGGPKEGIQVHGHWMIEVRNPDGTLVTRREFENELTGNSFLARSLGRQITPGYWQVDLIGSAFSPTFFITIPEAGPAPGTSTFPNLLVSVPTTGANANALVLKGSGTALADGEINKVGTQNFYCESSITPAACVFGTNTGQVFFTATALTPTLTGIVEGQIIQVTVTISFSSPSQ